MLTPAFAGELFGPGQPLDAAKYYIILPDGIGHGKSTKPSDGLRAKFPHYNYDDMVDAQYRLVTEGPGHQAPAPGDRQLHGRHAHLALGREISGHDGCARTDGVPADRDVSRNWMMRRMIVDSIRTIRNGTMATTRLSRARSVRRRVLRHRHQRRHARIPRAGADTREGRQDPRRAAGRAVHGRRQRCALPMGIVGQLQRRAGTERIRRRCWRSTPRTTSATRPRPA